MFKVFKIQRDVYTYKIRATFQVGTDNRPPPFFIFEEKL